MRRLVHLILHTSITWATACYFKLAGQQIKTFP